MVYPVLRNVVQQAFNSHSRMEGISRFKAPILLFCELFHFQRDLILIVQIPGDMFILGFQVFNLFIQALRFSVDSIAVTAESLALQLVKRATAPRALGGVFPRVGQELCITVIVVLVHPGILQPASYYFWHHQEF